LDVFVLFQSSGMLTSLTPIYDWAKANGYESKSEHIIIADLPVQLIPAYNLEAEAVETAVEMDYDNVPVRVIRPEYLIAMALQPSARTAKRLARVASLLEQADVDRDLLNKLLERYNLALPSTE
jgi:hypothetical protein